MHPADAARSEAGEAEQDRGLEEQGTPEGWLAAASRMQDERGRDHRAEHERAEKEQRAGGEPPVPLGQLVSGAGDDSRHVRRVGAEREKAARIHRSGNGRKQRPEDVPLEAGLVEEEPLHEERVAL